MFLYAFRLSRENKTIPLKVLSSFLTEVRRIIIFFKKNANSHYLLIGCIDKEFKINIEKHELHCVHITVNK